MASLFVCFLAFVQLSFAAPIAPIPIHPDQDKTPGEYCDAQDKDFKEYRYAEKMPYCERNVSKGLKSKIYAEYGVPSKCKNRYTVDHFVPLALGGNNSQENLWPEHVLVKETRQQMEQDLYEAVSQGHMTSEEALHQLLQAKTQLMLDLSGVDGCG